MNCYNYSDEEKTYKLDNGKTFRVINTGKSLRHTSTSSATPSATSSATPSATPSATSLIEGGFAIHALLDNGIWAYINNEETQEDVDRYLRLMSRD